MPVIPALRIIAVWLFVSVLLVATAAATHDLGLNPGDTLLVVGQPIAVLGLAMLLASRIAWRLIGDREAVCACLTMALSIPALSQFDPLNFDLLAWQMVGILVVLNGLLERNHRLGGWIVGLASAALLSQSLSLLPIIAAVFAIIALKWLRNRSDRMLLVHATQAQSFALIGIFLVTMGTLELAASCESIGLMHLAASCWIALIISALSRVGPIPSGALLGGLSLAIGGAVGILMLDAGGCPNELAAPGLLRDSWSGSVPNMNNTISIDGLGKILEIAALPLIGIWASFQLMARNVAWLRAWWLDYTILLIVALLFVVCVPDYAGVAAAISAAPIGWQLCRWLDATARMGFGIKRLMALIAVMTLLMPSIALDLAARIFST